MIAKLVSKEELYSFAKKLFITLDNNDISKIKNNIKLGFDIYRKGYVYNLSRTSNSLTACIINEEGPPFDSVIDLVEPTRIINLEPIDYAVIFSAFSSVDRAGTFIDLWKERIKANDAILNSLKGPKINISSHSKESLSPTKSVELWKSDFEQKYIEMIKKTSISLASKSNKARVPLQLNQFLSEEMQNAPRDDIDRSVYSIVLGVYIFDTFIKTLEEEMKLNNFVSTYLLSFAERILLFIKQNIQKLQPLTKTFEMLEFEKSLSDDIRKLLDSEFVSSECYKVYTEYWLIWSTQSKLLEKELSKCTNKNALAFLHTVNNEVDKGLEIHFSLGYFKFSFVEPILDFLKKKKDWIKLEKWLTYCEKQIPVEANSRGIIATFFSYYSFFYEHTGISTAYEDALKKYLPYSAVEYEQYLFEESDRHKWVELQFYIGLELDEHNIFTIEQLEKERHESLFPIYHRLIDGLMKKKGKSNYVLANKYLVKLKELYFFHNKQDYWDSYFKMFFNKHQKLRSFLDIIKKGSLLHD
ncbi:MAG: hypothetical protein K0S51_1459 [Bacillales bacterium]|nr:hypothetical protein [Bacillales bacterium]